MEKVGVIYGGKSVEHDISIITALQTIKKLSKEYECVPIYIDGEGNWWTGKNLQNLSIYADFDKKVKQKKQVLIDFNNKCILLGKKRVKVKMCFVCSHGLNGEDGTISGVLELADIPYSCSGVLSSALSMDKITTKILLEKNGIETVEYVYFDEEEFLNNRDEIYECVESLGYPVIVKPANLGSSVGISVAKNASEFVEKVEIGLNFDKKILVERFLSGAREFNCACFVYEGECYPSNVVEVNKGEIFSFEDKYITGTPAFQIEVCKEIIDKVKQMTKEVYKICQCFGIVRVDYLYRDGIIYVNEINNITGSLASALYPDNYSEVLDLVIKESINREKKKEEIKYSFSSNVLKVFEKCVNSAKMKK